MLRRGVRLDANSPAREYAYPRRTRPTMRCVRALQIAPAALQNRAFPSPTLPPMKPAATLGPGTRADQTLAWNMRLLAHHELQGFGGMGEGMALQAARDGRRILWLAHESAPKNFTGVDVTDPRAPKVVVQTDLPHAKMRSNSLDVVGDVMAVAYQTSAVERPAGRLRSLRHLDAGVAEADRALRRLGAAFARRARGVVRRRRVRAHGERRRGLQAAEPEGRPVLPHRRRPQPVEAGRGGPLVAARDPGRRRCAAAAAPAAAVRHRLPGAQHQRIPARGRTGRTSATSTAARSSSTSPTSRARSSCRGGATRRRSTASRTRCCRSSSAGC